MSNLWEEGARIESDGPFHLPGLPTAPGRNRPSSLESGNRSHPRFRDILSAGTRPLKHAGLGFVANERLRADRGRRRDKRNLPSQTRENGSARRASTFGWPDTWGMVAPYLHSGYHRQLKTVSPPLALVFKSLHCLPSLHSLPLGTLHGRTTRPILRHLPFQNF
jgi:hypothetical protein